MENLLTRSPQSIDRLTKIDEETAIAEANGFILDHLPDRFCAGVPRLVLFHIRAIWAVPILLSYPEIGPVGEVGIIAIDTEIGNVVGWTPFAQVTKAAEKIYSEKKDQIEAAFS